MNTPIAFPGRCFAELPGTFWLVLGGCGSAVPAAAFPGVGIGFLGVALIGGIDFNHSSFSTPLIQDSVEAYFGDDYNYKLSAATSFYQNFRMLEDLSNTGTYRMNSGVGAATKISKWLTWNFIVERPLSQSPGSGPQDQ